MTRPYITWRSAVVQWRVSVLDRTSEMEAHYARFDNPDMDTLIELDNTYVWDDLYDLLSILDLDWLEEAVWDYLHDIDHPATVRDTWSLVADAFEDVGGRFGDLVMALDMYLDGRFDDDADDSIGRMEDYEVATC